VLHGTSNVYRDLGQNNADVKQFKALLAAEIIKTFEREVHRCVGRRPAPGSLQRISPVWRHRRP